MAKTPSHPSSPTRDARPKLLWLWVALGAVVALLAGFAILSAGDDDAEVTVGSTAPPSGGEGGTETTAGAGSGQFAETWPVEISGSLVPKPDGDDPAVGQPAPTLSGFSFDGTPVVVDPSKGPVMLVFLAHWCPHCNREVPALNEWRDSGGVPDGLQVIAVTTAVRADAEHYPPSRWITEEMAWTWPVLADSPDNEAAVAFGVSGFPFSVIVGQDGTVLGRSSGEMGREGIERFVADSLA
jgi:thiol-disulfide isomerase/thioredoxin